MKHLTLLLAMFAAAAFADLKDYKREAKENFNGYPGVTLITWTQETPKKSRAWALKFDLSKGYRLRAKLGDKNAKRATVGAMAEELLAAGEDVVCGINGDYFDMKTSDAKPVGFVIENGKLTHRGWEPFTSKWQKDWVESRWYIMETDDHRIVHGVPDKKGAWKEGQDRPETAADVCFNKRKILNALETNWCNYPVKDGKRHILGNCQKRDIYPRVLVGLGTDKRTRKDFFIMFLNDGRQPDWSFGMLDIDSADALIAEGCKDVGEFDGGGSASMWVPAGKDAKFPRDTTENGGYLNLSSDKAPRKDATGLFMIAPKKLSKKK